MSAELTHMLTVEETPERFVYLDSRGFSTIGIGRNVDSRNGKGLSNAEMSILLSNDIIDITSSAPGWILLLDPPRRDALLALIFQLGLAKFLTFIKLIGAVKNAQWDIAASELLNSRMAVETPDRARRLAKQLQTNTYVYKY